MDDKGAVRGEGVVSVGHTPGPWRWWGGYLMQDCRDETGARIDNPYSTPAGRPIADDGSAGGEYGAKIHADDADAHLIAAAPDMFDLLHYIAHSGESASLAAETLLHFRQRASALVRKARGLPADATITNSEPVPSPSTSNDSEV